MKKIILAIFICVFTIGLISIKADAAQNKVPQSVAPAVSLYRGGNYVGAIQVLEDVLEKDANNVYAKYYLALCHTRLGHEEEAQDYYDEVIEANNNQALVFYAKKAKNCLEDPEGEACIGAPADDKNQENSSEQTKKPEVSDIVKFIQSGQKIHPAALDNITKERMQRKLERFETEQRNNPNLKSDNSMPTNEEIAAALNTLSKIGINPYQINQYPMLSNNYQGYNPMYGAMLQNTLLNTNPETAKMLLYNQMLGSNSNGLLNYGI